MPSTASILKDAKTYKALFAEFLGTLLLVFVGCGSGTEIGASVTKISLAVGFMLASLVQTIGHISGGHVNPSVTVSMMVTRKMNIVLGILYILVQSLGALAGIFILKSVMPGGGGNDLGVSSISEEITPLQACGVEFLATFVLVFTIFGVCDGNRDDVKGSAPLAIGLSATAACLVAMKFTGASLNPARSIGPAILARSWKHHWVYWVGPCLGGAVAGLLYQGVFSAPKQKPTPKPRGDYEMCAKDERL